MGNTVIIVFEYMNNAVCCGDISNQGSASATNVCSFTYVACRYRCACVCVFVDMMVLIILTMIMTTIMIERI